MAHTVRIKRRSASAAAPTSLANAELAFNESSEILYYGKGTGGVGGTASSIIPIGGIGAFVDLTNNQSIAGTKTFTGTVIVPTPTANTHAATKTYVDTNALSTSTTSTQSGYFGDIFLYDDSTPSHYLQITNSANLSAARILSLNVNDANRTVSLSGDLTVSANATVSGTNTGDQTIGNATLTLAVSGTGLSGSQTFTANQSTNATFTVTSNATNANTASTIVARDASGNFSAGTVTLNGLTVDTNTLHVDATNDRVGIGTTTPGFKLEVNGSFAATTKSFVIDHPTKPDKKLCYGSLEGPENGVYVRGKSDSPLVILPDYWHALVDESTITVNITPIGKLQNLWIAAVNAKQLIVYGSDTPSFYYTVWAERKDVPKLKVEA